MTKTKDVPAKTKPVHRIRSGALEVAIWQNEGERGPWFSVTTRRSYKKEGEWKDADSFGQDDLLALAKLLDLAHTWILDQEQLQRSKQAA